jgi:hypothetical protein
MGSSSAERRGTGSGSDPLAPVPEHFLSDIAAGCGCHVRRLGSRVVVLHGAPPFCGGVGRGSARVNIRHVGEPVIVRARAAHGDFLATVIPVDDVSRLHEEFRVSARLYQALSREPWGARTFIVAEPDENLLLFPGPCVATARTTAAACGCPRR